MEGLAGQLPERHRLTVRPREDAGLELRFGRGAIPHFGRQSPHLFNNLQPRRMHGGARRVRYTAAARDVGIADPIRIGDNRVYILGRQPQRFGEDHGE